jgi:hypothetical protein
MPGTRRSHDAVRARLGCGALGQARDDAKAEIAKLAKLREKLHAAKDAYWAEQVESELIGLQAGVD